MYQSRRIFSTNALFQFGAAIDEEVAAGLVVMQLGVSMFGAKTAANIVSVSVQMQNQLPEEEKSSWLSVLRRNVPCILCASVISLLRLPWLGEHRLDLGEKVFCKQYQKTSRRSYVE